MAAKKPTPTPAAEVKMGDKLVGPFDDVSRMVTMVRVSGDSVAIHCGGSFKLDTTAIAKLPIVAYAPPAPRAARKPKPTVDTPVVVAEASTEDVKPKRRTRKAAAPVVAFSG